MVLQNTSLINKTKQFLLKSLKQYLKEEVAKDQCLAEFYKLFGFYLMKQSFDIQMGIA